MSFPYPIIGTSFGNAHINLAFRSLIRTFAGMKYLVTIIVVLVALCCCTTEADRNRMRSGLDSINQRNRNGEPFTVQDVKPYVQFFDDHGTPNDRLLAHYLLGLAYYDHGEAPMALECYQKAAECADTTSQDCDYAQLSRVYGQMAEIFYSQFLFKEQIVIDKKATKYAWKGKDTLAALRCYEQQVYSYLDMGMHDSAFTIAEDVARQYQEHGYKEYSATVLGSIVRSLIEKDHFDKARRYSQIYESSSGHFDNKGNVDSGRELYYYTKGLLCLKENKMDSAEYWFRKELREGLDYSNQNAAALGLAMTFEKNHKTDSASKYYHYAYVMNDSSYSQMVTTEIGHMQSMYDYSRYKDIARQEKEKADEESKKKNRLMWTLLLLVFSMCLGVYFTYYRTQKRKRLYLQNIERLEKAQTELMLLREHANDYQDLISEKETEIDHLKKELANKRVLDRQNHSKQMEEIHCSAIYADLKERETKHKALTKDILRRSRMLVIEKLPEFNGVMMEKKYELKENDFNVCMLLRLGFKSKEISYMLKLSQPRVSQICAKVLGVVFNASGGAKELSDMLYKYY